MSDRSMRAARFHGGATGLRLDQVPWPVPGPDDVVVRVAACGICGSDVHFLEGMPVPAPLPVTLGHEPAGVVEAVGAKVRGWNPATASQSISVSAAVRARRVGAGTPVPVARCARRGSTSTARSPKRSACRPRAWFGFPTASRWQPQPWPPTASRAPITRSRAAAGLRPASAWR